MMMVCLVLKVISEYQTEIGTELAAEAEGIIVSIQFYITIGILVEIKSSVQNILYGKSQLSFVLRQFLGELEVENRTGRFVNIRLVETTHEGYATTNLVEEQGCCGT